MIEYIVIVFDALFTGAFAYAICMYFIGGIHEMIEDSVFFEYYVPRSIAAATIGVLAFMITYAIERIGSVY